jgi:hypothetical protein
MRGNACHCPEGTISEGGKCVAQDGAILEPMASADGGMADNAADSEATNDVNESLLEAGRIDEGGSGPQQSGTSDASLVDAQLMDADRANGDAAQDAGQPAADAAVADVVQPGVDAAQPCGDGVCDLRSESSATCAADCGPACFRDGLRALWRGEGDAKDSMGNADATLNGSAAIGAGYAVLGFRLESAPAYLSVADPNGALRFGSNDFSVELWAKLNTFPGEVYLVGRGCPNCGNPSGYRLALYNAGRAFAVAIGTASGRINCAGGASADDAKWHHYAATFDRDGDVTLYVDGAELVRCDIRDVSGSTDTPGDLLLGIFNPGDANLDGRLDDVAFYSSLLSAQQVAAIAGASTGKCTRP